MMPETLQPEKRKPFNGMYVQPFNFVRLFSTTPMLTRMTFFNLFQTRAFPHRFQFTRR